MFAGGGQKEPWRSRAPSAEEDLSLGRSCVMSASLRWSEPCVGLTAPEAVRGFARVSMSGGASVVWEEVMEIGCHP